MRCWTGPFDLEKPAAVGMAGDLLDLDGFAGQAAGHVDRSGRPVGDAVAAMAEPGNHDPLNHAPPR